MSFEASVRSTVDAMTRPLVTDGWEVRITACDPVARTVEVYADQSGCADCYMSPEALAGLLQEALDRSQPGVTVTVQGAAAQSEVRLQAPRRLFD